MRITGRVAFGDPASARYAGEIASPVELGVTRDWDYEMDSQKVSKPKKTRGATAVEYALILALIAGVIIASVGILGTRTQGLYEQTEIEMVNAGL